MAQSLRDIPSNIIKSVREIISTDKTDYTRPINTNVENNSNMTSTTGGINLSGGSGGKRLVGGIGGTSPSNNLIDNTELLKQQQEAQKKLQEELEKQQQAQALAEYNKIQQQKQSALRNINQNQNSLRVNSSGRVIVGSGNQERSYTGNAYIKELGMTANQYNDKIRREAVARGDIGIENYGKASFSGSIPEENITNQEVSLQNISTAKPIFISERTYRLLEERANNQDQEAYQLLQKIKQSGGGYESRPADRREWAKVTGEVAPVYARLNPITNAPVNAVFGAFSSLNPSQQKKVLTTAEKALRYSTSSFSTGNVLFGLASKYIPEKVKDKIANVMISNVPSYNTGNILFNFIPQKVKEKVANVAESGLKSSIPFAKQNILNSPIVDLATGISKITPEARSSISRGAVKVYNTADKIKDKTYDILFYKGVSGATDYLFPNLKNTIPSFVQSPLYSRQPFTAIDIVKASPNLINNPLLYNDTRLSVFSLLKASKPYVERGLKKAEPYVKKALPYVNLLGYKAPISSGNVLTAVKTSAPYIKPFINNPSGFISPMNPLISDINQARNQEFKSEETARRISGAVSILSSQSPTEQEKSIKQLKSLGVKFENVRDYQTGETATNIVYPKWMQNLRPEYETKTQKETFVPFFLRKFKQGISENTADIYQRAVFKGATLTQPSQSVVLNQESRIVGGVFGTGAEVGMFAVPVISDVAFLGGTTEALTRGGKGFIQFAREEPYQVIGAGAYGLFAGYRGTKEVKELIRPTKPNIKITKIRPKISTTKELDDTVFMGERAGLKAYSSTGRIISQVKYPKRFVKYVTDVWGNTIEAVEGESSRLTSKALALTEKQGAFKILKDESTGKVYISSAESSGIINPTKESQRLFTGQAETRLKNLGEIKFKTNAQTGKIYFVIKKNPKVSESLSNIKSLFLGKKEAVRDFNGRLLKGEQSFSFNTGLSDTYTGEDLVNKDLSRGFSSLFIPTGRVEEEAVRDIAKREATRKSSQGFIQSLYAQAPKETQKPVSVLFSKQVETIAKGLAEDLSQPIVKKTIIPAKVSTLDNLLPVSVKTTARTSKAVEDLKPLQTNRFTGTEPTGRFGDLGVAESRLDIGLNNREDIIIKPAEETNNRNKNIPKNNLDILNNLGLKEQQQNKQKDFLTNAQITKEQQEQTQINLLRNLLRTQQITKQPERPRPENPFKLILPKPSSQPSKPKYSAKPIVEEMFKIFKRVKGNDVFVAEESTAFKAEQRLKSELKRDLSASGFIELLGKKLKAKQFSDWDFGVSKKEPYRVVQKVGGKFGGSGRLSTMPEVKQINIFKGKRKKLKDIWDF